MDAVFACEMKPLPPVLAHVNIRPADPFRRFSRDKINDPAFRLPHRGYSHVLKAISIAVLFVTAFCHCVFGSTVVVIQNRTKVFIASDSKMINEVQGRIIGDSVVCKIHTTKRVQCCVAVAQGLMNTEPISGEAGESWNIWSDIDSAINRARSVREAVSLANRGLMISFKRALAAYSGRRGRGKAYFNYAVAGIASNGQAVVAQVAFPAPKDLTIQNPIISIRTFTGQTLGLICLGECDAVNNYRKENPRWFVGKGGYGEIAKSLVAMEISALPSKVGGPVALIVLSKVGGIEWRSRGACE